MPSRTWIRRTAAAVATTAIVATSLVTAAMPASAATTLDPANEITGATVTFDPTTRSGTDVNGNGMNALSWGPSTIAINRGCPEGFRSVSRTFVINPAGELYSVALRRNAVFDNGKWGLKSGDPIFLEGEESSSWVDLEENVLLDGVSKFVITCDSQAWQSVDPIHDAKYFLSYLTVDRANSTWTWSATDPAGPSKTATSTTLTHGTPTQTSVVLTATVDKTAASGTVQFTKDGANVGGPAIVTGGVATTTVTGLTPGTAYSFAAAYSGDATYAASTGTVTATTAGTSTPGDGTSTPIDVNVPAVGGPSGLKITVPQGSVLLAGGGTRASGETWTATGLIDNVTVNDDRRSAGGAAWTLNGKVSAFASGTNSIAGSSLGWAPEKITGPGVAGAAVIAGDGNGLSVDRPLATGSASGTSNVETKVKAALTLKVPAAAPAGAYSGTLTLTLI